MKKFEPKQELEKMKNNTLSNSTKFKGFFIPMLVLICSVVAIIGTTYSSKNATINDGFTIRVDIINGEEDYYLNKILKKADHRKENIHKGHFHLYFCQQRLYYQKHRKDLNDQHFQQDEYFLLE